MTLAALPTVLVVVQSAVVWDWRAVVSQPMSELGAVAAVVALGWVVWLALVWQVVRDTVAAVRGRRRPSAWLPVPLHTAITAMASGILLALDTARAGSAGPALAGPLPGPVNVDTGRAPSPGAAVPARTVRADAGVHLPGGWLPLPVVAAVAAAVALAWAQARRRYPPRPPAGWDRNDPDLPPLSAPVRQVLRAAQMLPDEAPYGHRDTPERVGSAPLGTVAAPDAAAETGDDAGSPRPLDLLETLPHGELRLIGPGRHDAARGMLVAFSAMPERAPRIVLTAAFVSTVLGMAEPAAGVLGTPGAARRSDAQGGFGTVVFAADVEPGEQAAALGGTADGSAVGAGETVDCTIRVAAAQGVGVCWHVGADGTVRPVAGAGPADDRLPILDQRTALDILRAISVQPSPGHLDQPEADTPPAPATTDPDRPTGWPDGPPDHAGAARRLLVRVFGGVTVLQSHPDGSYSPVPVRRSAGQQILVLLALHRDGLTDDELKEALWPDVLSSAAQRRYLTTLSELRRALHNAAGRPVLRHDDLPGTHADAASRRQRLDPAAVQVDLWRLQGLIDAAASAADRDYRRLLLTSATDVAGGELAAGWWYEWLLADRERVVRHLLDVHTSLADDEPDDRAALRLLRQALRLAPTNEHVHRQVLQRHAAAGDDDGLRRAAATLTEHLTAHNLQPEAETVALLTTVLARPARESARQPATLRRPVIPEQREG
ncbi:AfsR/SARP family transcriptional regulator [Dactylosporangium sp. McL0621]|uniref:AfsR/SARP family transcriptional regulator n=1 Tax=Dactylosporangium sp. McL0621 TaxID=3415678 RepID=UPI003CEE92F2